MNNHMSLLIFGVPSRHSVCSSLIDPRSSASHKWTACDVFGFSNFQPSSLSLVEQDTSMRDVTDDMGSTSWRNDWLLMVKYRTQIYCGRRECLTRLKHSLSIAA